MSKRVKTAERASSPFKFEGYGGVLSLIASFADFGTAGRMRLVGRACAKGVAKTWTRDKIRKHLAAVLKAECARLYDALTKNAPKLPGVTWEQSVQGPHRVVDVVSLCSCQVCGYIELSFYCISAACTRMPFASAFGVADLAIRMIDCLIHRELCARQHVIHQVAEKVWPQGPAGGEATFVGPYPYGDAAELMRVPREFYTYNRQELKLWMIDPPPEPEFDDTRVSETVKDIRVWRRGRCDNLDKCDFNQLEDETFPNATEESQAYWVYSPRLDVKKLRL